MLGIRRPLKLLANGRNIVGCYMLPPFAHPVACCCVLLGVCCAKSETLQTFMYVEVDATTPNNVVGQQCYVRVFARGFIQTRCCKKLNLKNVACYNFNQI